ncbi:hypothetical protein [Streptomyces sp. MspMP-M5]|uniref:hypothetical protein n=1 Tax=unclassified Streptomyces TaxID=2593676 RepID=UPI0003A28FC7|nr:hypothetical protein [Streptomyces sp. MspMP-M5]
MPGDELHVGAPPPEAGGSGAASGAAGDSPRRTGSGPRHAAPRKPLLTRLHVPAGKAIAIAAMPSAVLMGMGLTPQMAIAKPAPPQSPFRGGPCVTAPDTSGQDAKAKDGAKDGSTDTKDAKGGKDAAKGSGKDAGGGTPSAAPSASPSPSPSAAKDTAGGSPSPSASATPSPAASPEKKDDGGLLGGIGDALGGLFGIHKKSDEPSAAPSPSPSASATKAPSPSPTPSASSSKSGSSQDSGPGPDEVTKPVGDALKDPSKAVNDTVHGAVGTVDNALPGGGLDGKDASGKPGYPCVVENKQQGKDEQTPATLPDLPWHLESSGLTLRGLDYVGVVNVTTQNGHTKQALKFTADSIDIGDLHQIVDDPASGKHYHVRSTPGSTSTIRGGKVTLYTERLQGNLFGLIPIVFDPEHPPPLNVPYAYFSKVKLDQAGQFGGNLHVPGMQVSIED